MSSWQNKLIKLIIRLNRLLVKYDKTAKVGKWRAIIENQAALTSFPQNVQKEKVLVENMPGAWIFPKGLSCSSPPVVLFLHGGGYIMGSIHSYQILAANIAVSAGAKVLIVEYRLAPESAFPAAVDDAICAYRWLLEQRIDPARIVILGDSAGGGLALASLVGIKQQGLPMPAAAVCLSPWTDLALTGDSIRTKVKEDPLFTPALVALAVPLYLKGADPKTPLASPLYADLKGLPPILIHVGTAELLYSDSTRFAEKAKQDGVEVHLEIWEELFHVFHMFAAYVPEGRAAIKKIGLFIQAKTKTAVQPLPEISSHLDAYKKTIP